uniref:Uncharacterized protein n=1 Tax=Lepeophtheirus salmonis TaxID=72036 RepID=A0A0K2U6D6_LEPSM
MPITRSKEPPSELSTVEEANASNPPTRSVPDVPVSVRSRITEVRLPHFDEEDFEIWFARVDSIFRRYGIVEDEEKANSYPAISSETFHPKIWGVLTRRSRIALLRSTALLPNNGFGVSWMF